MSSHPATTDDSTRSLGKGEFIALMALMMSMTALSIDLMLPAFGSIRAEFGLEPDSTAVAGLVTAYLLGLSISQLFYGILADRFGRKPLIYAGLTIYLVGAIGSVFAPSLGFLLVARFVWGVGAAGPRVLTLSIVRDTHQGADMARLMSMILAVFILVPVVAPSIGALLTDWTSWRGAFAFAILVALVVALWALRLPETLAPDKRRAIGFRAVVASARIVLGNRTTMLVTLALTALFGVFLSYVASSEIIFTEVFDRGEIFPILFGAIAAVMGVGMLINSWLAVRLGLRPLVTRLALGYVVVATTLAVIGVASGGRPGLFPFVICLAALALFQALLIPNLNAVAMIPMGEVAGMASAIIGTVSTGLAALIGASIDQTFDGSVAPLSLAFAVAAWATFGLIKLARIGDLDPPDHADVLEATIRSPSALPEDG